MFKLQPHPTFPAKVHVTVPGQEKPETIEVDFLWLAESERVKLIETRSTGDFLVEVVKAWRGVDAEFSVDALKRLLANYPRSPLDFLEAYNRELFGARAKN